MTTTTGFAGLELALLRRPVPVAAPPPDGAEMTGRGYRRPPVGAVVVVVVEPPEWENVLPILWPQALGDWGAAATLALLSGAGAVLAQTPLDAGFHVRAGDQAQIMRHKLQLFGPAPLVRGYGAGGYGLGPFGGGVVPVAGYGAGSYGVGGFASTARTRDGEGRPFGVGLYGVAPYGVGDAGSVNVVAIAAEVGLAWARQANECGPWPAAPPIVAGGCA